MKHSSVALLIISFSGVAGLSGQTRIPGPDMTFAQKAANGGEAEVEMGKMARDKASNQKVKDFGSRMVSDHSTAAGELKSLAARKGMNLPSGPDSESKAIITKFSALSGPEFDRAYMRDMVSDHEKDVAEFKKEADSGSDPDLKKWAAETLPILEKHLALARETLKAVQ